MKYFILPIALVFSLLMIRPGAADAQQQATGSLTGKVLDDKGQAISFATVTLLKTSDSSLVKGALTNEQGDYRFGGLAPGSYLLAASEIGMTKAFLGPVTLDGTHLSREMKPFRLQPGNQQLTGIQVQAAKPFIQHKPGQTVVNVENSPVSAGNTVMEVLEKAPGVLVDQNDNISLNGKSGVNVMIDGRPTHLSSSQLGSLLKGMPASAVSSIELMTQPPSKYSAEGTAGLINIVLKKNTALGFNGSVTAGLGYGQYLKYSAGTSLNYRNKHFSLYGNYDFNYGKNKFEMDISRDFYEPDSKQLQTTLKQASIMKVSGYNHTAQLGMDYYLTPKQTIGFVANGTFIGPGSFNTYSPVQFLDPAGHTDSISTSTNHTGYNWDNASANVHYNWDMDDKGSSLVANVDYNRFYQSMPQLIKTQVLDGEGNALHEPDQRRGEQPNRINIYAAKVDYTHPLSHQAKLEAGLKFSYVHTDNNSAFEVLKGNQWVNDPGNTNHFVYQENVNAAYINLSKTFKKGWSAQAGLRAEQTTTKTDQMTTDSLNKNHYFELFPNIALTRTINPNNVLSLSYSRRIDRPNYQNLNPFVYYVDEYTYRVGNPYLDPQFVNTVELSYTFKQRYSAVLSYTHTSDIMAQVIRQIDSTHATFQTQDNISKLDNLTLNLGIPVTVTPWWSMYNSLMGFYNLYDGIYDGYSLHKGFVTFMINTQQSFILPHGWKAELSGMYRTSTIMGPSVASPMGMISAGIGKSFWDNKASLKLNVQDILQSLNMKGKIAFGNLHASSEFHTLQRAANLTFTWNFGNRQVKVKKYKNTGIKEEEQRIQKGTGAGSQ